MRIQIPEEHLMVIMRAGTWYFFYDNRDPLDIMTIAWKWDGRGHIYSDGRHIGVWMKFVYGLEECQGKLEDFDIPHPKELEVIGQWEEYYISQHN